jgi:phosphoenolpyruvate carboxylase
MSTQHPDNARVPEWCEGEIINGDAEIEEAYFAYRMLGCQEVMWDSEGKDVDTRVVRKLLAHYGDYFREHRLGVDLFLTYRIPNPRIERVERKIIVETLQNIPVTYDVASTFYQDRVAPIFEVILPFTTEGQELVWLYNYYRKAVAAAGELVLDGSTRVKDWVGSFEPPAIEVIPLVEDFDSLLSIDKVILPYLEAVKPPYLRVFIARSDPALNYGLIPAVLLAKAALAKLRRLELERGVPIHPILGVGTLPFRGHLAPNNLEGFLAEYPGLATATIQSALKYDYPIEEARRVVETLNHRLPSGEADILDPQLERGFQGVLASLRAHYQSLVELLAPLVNGVAAYVPPRRARKLHIGLFGYSRSVRGVSLPRAIPFAAALYTLGIPPEFLGCRAVTELKGYEWDLLERYYTNLKADLAKVAGFISWENLDTLMNTHQAVARRVGMPEDQLREALSLVMADLQAADEALGVRLGPRSLGERKHDNYANNFLISFLAREEGEARAALLEAAKLRRCLG